MPCLELKVASQPRSEPATRLRALLEKPGAAILRRNHVAEVPGYDNVHLRNRIRISAVLAVNLTDPPEETDPIASRSAAPEEPRLPSGAGDALAAGFAPGLEIWVADGDRAACIFADADELPGALAMFDAYLRLARFQPAFERLDQRLVGLHYLFREGLSVGVQGKPAETPPAAEIFFDCIAPIPEVDDFRTPHFVVRLPNEGLGFFHDLLRAASSWLQENSFPNILGSK
ncbi:MAG TPA: hypothetical protein VHZ09_15420 [Acidobacteriaceae bacterium]|jgi:hypothetical protein|nr:hypothetical protein [Acidobacteriaceae bacterium]